VAEQRILRESTRVSGRLTLVLWGSLLAVACQPSVSDPLPFGFQACFVVPPDPTGTRTCGFELDPLEWPWTLGPNEGFGQQDLAELARASLSWFEDSPEVEFHRRDRGAWLELVYPSKDLTVTVRHVPDLSWEHQLRAWFRSFPPVEASSADGPQSEHHWEVTFGAHGKVWGAAGTESEALDAMRELVANHDNGSRIVPSAFHLSSCVRRSTHAMDVYTAEVGALARLDELPRMVQDKRAQHERWR